MSEPSKPIGDAGRPRKKKLSVFALAKPSSSVCAEIDIDDVLHVRPDWTKEQATQFLSANAEFIGGKMVICGAAVLVALLLEKSDVN